MNKLPATRKRTYKAKTLKPNFKEFNNKEVRAYIYQNGLAISYLQFTGREVRQSSRTQLANFLSEFC